MLPRCPAASPETAAEQCRRGLTDAALSIDQWARPSRFDGLAFRLVADQVDPHVQRLDTMVLGSKELNISKPHQERLQRSPCIATGDKEPLLLQRCGHLEHAFATSGLEPFSTTVVPLVTPRVDPEDYPANGVQWHGKRVVVGGEAYRERLLGLQLSCMPARPPRKLPSHLIVKDDPAIGREALAHRIDRTDGRELLLNAGAGALHCFKNHEVNFFGADRALDLAGKLPCGTISTRSPRRAARRHPVR